ncbi:hypothetical protein [Salinicoccus halodurans]|uniref:Uncharacterized protein n=1 Tax=Salinicoccus halodurans TaxID=407035 RepID=A0A0F7D4J7_9STAP|nr:hypothetical protein [Salinicoccus halodurans]AKG74355.1 hypothetical protein AAT16_08985 [Salinicoccus halodurans]SFK94919.1 hypothetical protein SAMN05216235_2694 [Salinicoccus halodurans]
MNFKNILAVLLFFACAFPYISLIDTPFDTQPYALMLSTLIVILFFFAEKQVRVSRYIVLYGFFALYATLIFMFSHPSLDGIRSLVGYVSVFVIAFGSYLTFKYVKSRTLNIVIISWFLFGLIQLVISKDFGSSILPRLSTSESRGITSLAVEPSFYSIMCLFFFLYNDYFKSAGKLSNKKYWFNNSLLIIQIFISQAAIGVMILVFYLVLRAVSKGEFFKAFASILGVFTTLTFFIWIVLSNHSLLTTRAGSLIYMTVHDPMYIINNDGSVTDRLAHILISFISIFHNFGLGFGFGTWTENAFEEIGKNYSFIVELSSVNLTLGGRVMSGWGTVLYELGIIGLLFIIIYFFIIMRGYKKTKGKMKQFILYSGVTIAFIMMNAVPISLPIFCYSIGFLAYIGNNYYQEEKQLETSQ